MSSKPSALSLQEGQGTVYMYVSEEKPPDSDNCFSLSVTLPKKWPDAYRTLTHPQLPTAVHVLSTENATTRSTQIQATEALI